MSKSITLFKDWIAAEISYTTRTLNVLKMVADRSPDGMKCKSTSGQQLGHTAPRGLKVGCTPWWFCNMLGLAGDSASKPVYGYPLVEHLRVTQRKVAFPIELCVCALLQLGMDEEGLFRVTGGKDICAAVFVVHGKCKLLWYFHICAYYYVFPWWV